MADAELLTVAQVADALQVTAQTIRNWIAQGVLPALRVGRAYRIRREDVDELLDRAHAESDSLAASRDPWDPELWRLPRPARGGEYSSSVWEEQSARGLERRPKHASELDAAQVAEVLDGIAGAHERARLGVRQATSGDATSLDEL